MKVFDVPFALFAFLGFVAVVPAWVYFTTQHSALSSLSAPARFFVQASLPFSVLLYLASWLQPGGT